MQPAMDRAGGGRALLARTWPIIVVAAVYLVCLAILPLDGVWINDIGSRVIQLKGIVESNCSNFSLRWPGRAVDPDLDFAPVAYPFAVIRHDALFSVYSPLLAVLASPFYRLMGYPGLYVLPVAASLAMLAGLARLAGEVGGGARARAWVVLLAGLGTPIWFYSLTFWEHTLAAACCVWAVLYLVRFLGAGPRSPLVAAAALSAAGTYFRPEVYTFTLVLLLIVVWRAPSRRAAHGLVFALASLGFMVPLWVFQWATTGSALGFHIGALAGATTGILDHLRARGAMFYNLFCLASRRVALSVVATAPFLSLFFTRPRLQAGRFGAALPLASLVGLAITGAIFLELRAEGGSPIGIVGATNSLFPAVPMLMLGVAALRRPAEQPREEGARGTLWLVTAAYAVVYWLAAPGIARWGIHWGNRYLLVLYPLLAVPCAINLEAWQGLASAWGRTARRLSAAVMVAIVAASVAAQVWSVTVLQRKMDYSSRLNREVGARPEQAVAGPMWWIGQELYGRFYDKMIFRADSEADFKTLAGLLAGMGYSEVLAVIPSDQPSPFYPAGSLVGHVGDNGLGYWSVDLVHVNLGAARR